MSSERILDCKGLVCPQPVIKTKEALEERKPGQELHVIVDNEGSCSNVRRFAASQGHTVTFEEKDGNYHVHIIKGEGGTISPEPEIICDVPVKGSIFIYVSSDKMGRGDDALGDILMAAYFETLAHIAKDITHIAFVNSGVKLAIEGSPVLDHIKSLEQMGIQVLSCGTCLNHFGIKEKLAVGVVSNMFTILDAQTKAAKILSP